MGRKTSSPIYRKGMIIKFTIKNAIVLGPTDGGRILVKDEMGSIWNLNPNDPATEVSIIVPAHRKLRPGQVWLTDTAIGPIQWFVRESREEIPYRLTPENLTTAAINAGINTIDEATFFITYPKAKLVYSGRGETSVPIHITQNPIPGAADNGFHVKTYGDVLAPATK